MVLADVYRGRNLPGVSRGDIKKLLVLESLPKQVNFSGGQDLTSWGGTFTLERVLGTVPGGGRRLGLLRGARPPPGVLRGPGRNDLSSSGCRACPACMPGETLGCVGCHEQRTETPANPASGEPARPCAGRRAASSRSPAFPDVLDFTRDIQPILDRHCVECHNYARARRQACSSPAIWGPASRTPISVSSPIARWPTAATAWAISRRAASAAPPARC